MDLNALTDDEWNELFGDDLSTDPDDDGATRSVPLWAKLATGLAVLAMLLSAVPGATTFIRQIGNIDEPEAIGERADAFVQDAQWGWLVSRVVVVPLDPPDVGARVYNNPPNGVVELDHRSWDPSDIDETMAHEIGHLLDFALYNDRARLAPGREVRGGLESEAWAECAAVFVGERSLDDEGFDERYRCRPSELEVFEAEVALIERVCRTWGVPECR